MTSPATTPTPTSAEPTGPAPTQTDAQPVAQDQGTPEPASTSTGPLAEACARHAVRLYRQRGNSVARPMPYLAVGSPAREVADHLSDAMDDGSSVAAIAGQSGLSRATVRRTLFALTITEEIEAGDHDDLWGEDLEAVIFGGSDDEDGEHA